MVMVNLANKNVVLRMHPVLREKIDAQFLDICSYPNYIRGTLAGAQKYLTTRSVTVARGEEQNVYYGVCPLVFVLVENYGQALFDNLDVKAFVQDLTDEEVISRFWMQMGLAFGFMKVCRDLKITLTHVKNEGSDLTISPRPKIKAESFQTHVERLAVNSKPITEDLLGDPLVKSAGKVRKKNIRASAKYDTSPKSCRTIAADEKRQFQLGLS